MALEQALLDLFAVTRSSVLDMLRSVQIVYCRVGYITTSRHSSLPKDLLAEGAGRTEEEVVDVDIEDVIVAEVQEVVADSPLEACTSSVDVVVWEAMRSRCPCKVAGQRSVVKLVHSSKDCKLFENWDEVRAHWVVVAGSYRE